MFALANIADLRFQNEEYNLLVKKFSESKQVFSKKQLRDFTALFLYQQIDFNINEDYINLKNRVHLIEKEYNKVFNKLFFFSVLPKYYKTIFINIAKSKLSNENKQCWTRLLIEKPLGHNSKTAKELNNLLKKLFKENQVYRIEHYLAKDMVQAILPFRFGNNIFAWDNKVIDSINIRLIEKIDANDRGIFYETVGALRDVGQNHLLQMLALVTMKKPKS